MVIGLENLFVPIQKRPICPISALRKQFNPRDINHMPAVKFFARRISTKFAAFWMDTSQGESPSAAGYHTPPYIEHRARGCQIEIFPVFCLSGATGK
jgi:hypothetical protein